MRTSAFVFLLALVFATTIDLVDSDAGLDAGLRPLTRVERSTHEAAEHSEASNATYTQCRESSSHGQGHGPPAVEVAKWNWDHVGLYLTITVFIVLSGLAKVGKIRGQFHESNVKSKIPPGRICHNLNRNFTPLYSGSKFRST